MAATPAPERASIGGGMHMGAIALFINRRLPVPAFQVREHGDTLILTTEALALTYRIGADSLTASNIDV